MSPYPHIGEYKDIKKDYTSWYLISVMIGVGIFLLFLGLTKGLTFLISSLINLAKGRTVYFIIGVLILLLIIRKIKKKKKEEIPNEYRHT